MKRGAQIQSAVAGDGRPYHGGVWLWLDRKSEREVLTARLGGERVGTVQLVIFVAMLSGLVQPGAHVLWKHCMVVVARAEKKVDQVPVDHEFLGKIRRGCHACDEP